MARRSYGKKRTPPRASVGGRHLVVVWEEVPGHCPPQAPRSTTTSTNTNTNTNTNTTIDTNTNTNTNMNVNTNANIFKWLLIFQIVLNNF